MKYGGVLRACRERSGLNQEELAFNLNISQSDVSKFENNVKEPTISLLQAWINNTQSSEVLVAFLCGVDGLGIMQNILEMSSGIIGTILLGGIV